MIGLLPANIRKYIERFRAEPEFRELVSTSFNSLLVRMAGVGTGFLVTLVTSRYFGAEALGIVSICMGILLFAAFFGKFGLDVALMRYVAEFSMKKNFAAIKGSYLSSLRVIVPASLGISLLLYFCADWMAESVFHKPYLAPVLRINAFFVLPLVILLVHAESVRGLKKVKSYTFYQTAAISSIGLLLLVAAYFKGYLHRYIPVEVQFISILSAAILSLLSWSRYAQLTRHKASYEAGMAQLLKLAAPMFTTTVMQLIMSWAGILILASYASEADVGVFNALTRISIFTNITFLAINSLTVPRFAEAFAANDREALRRHSQEATRLIVLTSLPIFLVLALFPKFLLGLFGKEFPGNEISLYILLFGQLIVVLAGLPAQLLNMTGHQKILRNIAVISAIVNVLACFVFIPLGGIAGVSWAQVIGIFVWNFACIREVRREFGFYTFFRLRD